MADRKDDDRSLDAIRRSEDEDVRRRAREARDAGETIGRGMTSPDSTEAPLSAETGEPDQRALGDSGAEHGRDRGNDRGKRGASGSR